MRVFQVATTTSAPALTVIDPSRSAELFGVIASYAEAATFYVKFWFQGNRSAPIVLGTTAPDLTVPISSGAPGFLIGGGAGTGVIMQGPLYYAITANAAATDATALTTGGEIICIFVG